MIKPVTAVAAIILDSYDTYCEGLYDLDCGYLWLSFINNFSISLSLYCLVLFYMATEERLAPYHPFYKFMTVKAILFFSFWQSCLFQILIWFNVFSRDTSYELLNLITCGEMVVAAIAQSIAFTYKCYIDAPALPGARGSDNPHSVNKNRKQQQPGFCLKLLSLLTSTTDVIDDTRNTFIKSYDDDQSDRETQLDELMRCNDAFNWSDEELLDELDRDDRRQTNGKHNKSSLPRVKGGRKSRHMQAYQSLKKTVANGASGVQRGFQSMQAVSGSTPSRD